MYRLRNYILCVLISIILVFIFAAAEASVFAKYKAADPQTYRSLIEEKNIAADALKVISDKFESMENATGIPAAVYTDPLTEEKIKSIMNGCISDAFDYINGKSQAFEYSDFNEEFSPMDASIEKFFNDYADSEGYVKDDAFNKKVVSVQKNARDIVLENCDVFQLKKIEKAGYLKFAGNAVKYIDPAVIASLAAAGFFVLLLVIANIKKITNVFYWLSVSLGITSVFYLAAGIFLKVTGYFDRFAIKATHIFRAMTGTMYSFTDKLILINIVVFAAGLVFMMIFAVAAKEKKVQAAVADVPEEKKESAETETADKTDEASDKK